MRDVDTNFNPAKLDAETPGGLQVPAGVGLGANGVQGAEGHCKAQGKPPFSALASE